MFQRYRHDAGLVEIAFDEAHVDGADIGELVFLADDAGTQPGPLQGQANAGPEGEFRTPTSNREAGDSPERTIWAKVPFQTQRGRCVAVRCRGDKLWVAIAGSPAVTWLPARQVLTDEEAARWVATGF